MIDVAELRDLSVDDLQARAKELEDQLFRMRIQQSLGQLDAPLKLRFTRRDLARIKTVITEKQELNRHRRRSRSGEVDSEGPNG